MNYFFKSVTVIWVGYSTYCLWQAYSDVAVEVESSGEMEADSLGIFLTNFTMET